MALVGQDRRAHILHKGFVAAGGHRPIVPGPLSRRPGARVRNPPMPGSVFSPTSSFTLRQEPAAPRTRRLTASLYGRSHPGRLEGDRRHDRRGRTATQKRPDPVDALAVFIAAVHGGGSVLTSDTGDIKAYAATLPEADVSAVAI
ncbi:hypothetical protein NKH18_17635 [Streptomyces sp. M10(2022)]